MRRTPPLLVIAIFVSAFGSLGMECDEGCRIEQVDRIYLTLGNDDNFVDVSTMGPCHVVDRGFPQQITIQADGVGYCVITGTTFLAGEFEVTRTLESLDAGCGTMAYGVRNGSQRTIDLTNRSDGGVADGAI
jgi:hypothetical protein